MTANLRVLPWRTSKRGQWVEVETDQWARGFYLPSHQDFSSSLFLCNREAAQIMSLGEEIAVSVAF